MDRRQFLRNGAALTAFTLGLNAEAPLFLRRTLYAASLEPGRKKLIYIFLRGGMDALNAVVPRGDANYSLKSRPTLFLAPGEAVWLDGRDPRAPLDASLHSSAELHPSLAPLVPLYQEGRLAVLHRIGYRNHNQSHFDSQQFFENGTTDQPNLQEGMLYRQAVERLDLLRNPFVGFGLSDRQLVALKGRFAIPNAGDLRRFRLSGSDAKALDFLGRTPEADDEGRGFLAEYGGKPDDPSKPYRDEVHHLGVVMAEVMRRLRLLDVEKYAPAHGAVYPKGGFGAAARQAAQLLKETPVQLVGLNLDGWDTHGNQGKLAGTYPGLLAQVAETIRALSLDLKEQWNDVAVVTLSEFGRTSEENGSQGTDHGNAIVMFAAGGGVKGGVYNVPDPKAWSADGGVFSSKSGRYLTHWTDYRAVFAELFTKHFGDEPAVVNKVIPKYDALVAERPKEFVPLGFMA